MDRQQDMLNSKPGPGANKISVRLLVVRYLPKGKFYWSIGPWNSNLWHLLYLPVLLAGLFLVNCPTRWSLLFVFGFLYWSSSWRLGPHIGVCRLLWPLLRAGMAVLTHFFLQNVFSIYKTRAQKKFGNPVGGFTPPKKGFFPVPGPS